MLNTAVIPRAPSSTFQFGGISVDSLSQEEALGRTLAIIADSGRKQSAMIFTVNSQLVRLASREYRFANLLSRADFRFADGMSLVFASRALGQGLPERITGVDFVEHLCGRMAVEQGSVYLLGGLPNSADRSADLLRLRYPSLRIVGTDCPACGFEQSPLENAEVIRKIQKAKPDLLVVCLGAPKQEYWIENNLDALTCRVAIGAGSTLDVISGNIRRAPKGMQAVGLEWFFRLAVEPRRLLWRYATCNSFFLYIFVKQVFGSVPSRKEEHL